jgi:phage terminase large subunit-like protein
VTDLLAQLTAGGVDPGVLLKRLEGERDRRLAENRLAQYQPYPKQREFHAKGLEYRERLLIAANQVGKTICGAAETAIHLTGLYPDWWEGRRFDRATNFWAAGVTGTATRDNVQAKLIGPPEREEEWGRGFIPKHCLKSPGGGKPWSRAMGIPDLLDSCSVLHIPTQTFSTLQFKSYEQGREKWQGPTRDGMWFDEEPPPEIYSEGLTRTNAVEDAVVYLTFTPLLGMSDVVRMFLMPGSMQ